LKIVIVTSSTTYVKDNYFSLLKELTDGKILSEKIEISGIFFIKTASVLLLIKSLVLIFSGAFNFGITLLKNILLSIFFDRRESLCKKAGIRTYHVNDINDYRSIENIKIINPDLVINIRTRNIYRKEILDIPSIGCINIHHGILPDNRGTMCDLWAWYEKRPVGFTVHWMNEKIDDGKIIAVKTIDTCSIRNYIDIPMLSSRSEALTLIEILNNIQDGKIPEGESNKPVNKKYFKNPTLKQIKDIKIKGFIL
jgi:methionyl-tRNA formyltransferase